MMKMYTALQNEVQKQTLEQGGIIEGGGREVCFETLLITMFKLGGGGGGGKRAYSTSSSTFVSVV